MPGADHEQKSPAATTAPASHAAGSSHDGSASISAEDVLNRRAHDLINTRWWVDYNKVVGRAKGSPDRTQDDQLVVDSLKVRSDHEKNSVLLAGGNMADSGAVYLGEAKVPRGPGTVSAAYHYGGKRAFDIKLSLGATKPGDGALLREAHAEAIAYFNSVKEDRGDYAAIAADIQAQLASRFEGRELTVHIVPAQRPKATRGPSAKPALYSADADSDFEVTIVPARSRDASHAETTVSSTEKAQASSDQSGLKSTSDTDISKKISDAQSYMTSFQLGLAQTTQDVFKAIEEHLVGSNVTLDHKIQKLDQFKSGVAPAKDPKDGAAPSPKKPTKLGVVSRAGRWLFSKAKSLPIIGDGLELVGDLWDDIKVRGWVELEHSSTDNDGHSVALNSSKKTGLEISSLQTLATELKMAMTAETKHLVEDTVAAHFGIEASQINKRDSSTRENSTRTESVTRVEEEVSEPTITIRRR